MIVGLTLINNLVFLPALTLFLGGWLCKDKTAGQEKALSRRGTPRKPDGPSFWRRVGAFSTRYSAAIVVVTLLLAIPVSKQLINLTVSDNQDDLLPYDTLSGQAYQTLRSEFGSAMLSPLVSWSSPKGPYYIWSRSSTTPRPGSSPPSKATAR